MLTPCKEYPILSEYTHIAEQIVKYLFLLNDGSYGQTSIHMWPNFGKPTISITQKWK